jgi:hypothetical protein
MKLFLLILVSIIFINKAYNQNALDIKINIEIGSKRTISKVDVEGNFPDGDTSLRDKITKKLNTSKFRKNGAKRGKYTVRARFIVTKDGSISDVECLNDPGYGMGAESVRAIKGSSKWPPGPVRPMRSTYIVDSLKVPG